MAGVAAVATVVTYALWPKPKTASSALGKPPKLVVAEEGQAIWGSRFGNVTSVRVEPADLPTFVKSGLRAVHTMTRLKQSLLRERQ